MEKDGRGDFPTGSSGGGGKRGYGVRPSFLNPRGYETPSPTRNDHQNQVNRNVNNDNRNLNNDDDIVNWIDGLENISLNGQEGSSSLTTSSDQEYRPVNPRYDDGRNRGNAEVGGRQAIFNWAAYVGFGGYMGISHVHPEYNFRYLGPPLLGHSGLPLRLNGSNSMDYRGRPEMNNGGGQCDQGENGGSNARAFGQPVGRRFGGMYPEPRNGSRNRSGFQNGNIFYYTNTTAYAYRQRNGEVLSGMLSLRDPHIFNIRNATEYAAAITQICNNPDLQQAMINHLDCLKALLNRNLTLALSKQIAVVNAVMKLLNEFYMMQEEWTLPVIYTVTYDLRIISERTSPARCRGQVIITYDWSINNVACIFHPVDCTCHQPKVYPTRNFYRRF